MRQQYPYIGGIVTRTSSIQGLDWAAALNEEGPRYLQVVRFMERAITDGRLRPGDRLPPQRQLATALGMDLTTVTRAYAEARERKLLHANGAMGTFVSAPRFDTAQVVDLGMNIPPPPQGIDLTALLKRGVDQILTHTDSHLLMSYHPGGGSEADRAAGVAWLTPMLGRLDDARVVTCPGAQTALAALLLALSDAGETLLTEPVLYPGMISAATQLGRRLFAVESDADGMLPDALEKAAREHQGRVVYLNPTLRNPMATTMPLSRREQIVAVAQKHDLRIIEDDPYWPLCDAAPPPLARLAPERTFYIATLSKALTPGLRTAYAVMPDAASRSAFLGSLRAVTLMSTPVMTSLATQWIHDGTAARLLEGVRAEAGERQSMATRILRPTSLAAADMSADAGATEATPMEGIHLWLPLPGRWTARSLTMTARIEGLAVTPSDAFSAGAPNVQAIRISLGGVKDRMRLKQGLDRLKQVMDAADPAADSVVI
jgi:DNA-binding transcriptional MocR family regulator